jgi:hypothetical protein
MDKLGKVIIEDGIEYDVCVYPNNTKFWILNGMYHRINGPAVEWDDGYNEWYTYEDYIKEIYKIYGIGQVILIRIKYG